MKLEQKWEYNRACKIARAVYRMRCLKAKEWYDKQCLRALTNPKAYWDACKTAWVEFNTACKVAEEEYKHDRLQAYMVMGL